MIFRVTVSNINAHGLARRIQASGRSATVWDSLGAGAWGIEPGATAEFAGTEFADVLVFVSAFLTARDEDCAYAVLDGRRPVLLWRAECAPDEATKLSTVPSLAVQTL